MPEKSVKYIATEPLFIGRARAAAIGDEISADHLEQYGETEGWADKVEEVAVDDVTLATFNPAAGNIDEVLAFVDGDRDRAGFALQAEVAKGEAQRKTLVEQLQALIDA